MIESTEFETLEAFLDSDLCGFVILHQERALGNDFRDVEDTVTPKLAARFDYFLVALQTCLGVPDKIVSKWEPGLPAYASGHGYALWNGDISFTSLFVSWDNPEDPSFVIAARAPLSEFDSTPGAWDPWQSQWMDKGQW